MSKCVKCGNEISTGDTHWEMGLCNNCYNELYKDHKTHISLDKMWLEITQNFRNENEKLQDKVAYLEAKLAESEEYNKMLLEEKSGYIDLVSGYSKKCKNYEQQLAEKDKGVEKQNPIIRLLEKYKHDQKTRANDYYKQCKKANQDKISFAIEKLEKIDEFTKSGYCFDLFDVRNEIDNQIASLKKGVE